MKTTLFVAGFNARTRARNLAYEFERYGRLVRCDIPAPKSYSSKPYAFVEFENSQDAEDALNEMHGRVIDGYTLNCQWARIPNNGYNNNSNSSRDDHRRNYVSNNNNKSRSPVYRRERSSASPPPMRGRSPPPSRYDNNHLKRSSSPRPTSSSP